eukprot:scaffold347148_cov39-Prasinocladus_malaysianus.AAC.1
MMRTMAPLSPADSSPRLPPNSSLRSHQTRASRYAGALSSKTCPATPWFNQLAQTDRVLCTFRFSVDETDQNGDSNMHSQQRQRWLRQHLCGFSREILMPQSLLVWVLCFAYLVDVVPVELDRLV